MKNRKHSSNDILSALTPQTEACWVRRCMILHPIGKMLAAARSRCSYPRESLLRIRTRRIPRPSTACTARSRNPSRTSSTYTPIATERRGDSGSVIERSQPQSIECSHPTDRTRQTGLTEGDRHRNSRDARTGWL